MKYFVFLSFIFLLKKDAVASTFVTGGIYSNTTWPKTGSPYIVSGKLVVFENVELIIEPGVEVKFENKASLEIRGTMLAIGKEKDSILFTSNESSPTNHSWMGIKVIGTTVDYGFRQVQMAYCIGQYAQKFIDLDIAYQGPYEFTNCNFNNNTYVGNNGGLPKSIYTNCSFIANDMALSGAGDIIDVYHCHFIDNKIGAIGLGDVDSCYFKGNSDYALGSSKRIVNCTIEYNNIGAQVSFNSEYTTFTDNQVTNNNYGIKIGTFFNGYQNFTGNKICNNSIYNLELTHVKNAELSQNCWCSNDSAFIRSTIIDGYKNPDYGLVNFMPFRDSCSTAKVTKVLPPSYKDTSKVVIYPNPFNEKIVLEYSSKAEIYCAIFNYSGKKVFGAPFIQKIIINTEHFPEGIYIYEFRDVNKNVVQRGKIYKRH